MSASLTRPTATAAEWEPHVRAWITHLLAQGRTETTTAGYAHHVRALALAHPTTDPWRLTPAQLASWLDGHNWSANTRRRTLTSLRAFYAWATA
uniref:site-specific integrase n=1 Tax=Kribbia dieselivorans TaxID=331526 RepID=UPI00146FF352